MDTINFTHLQNRIVKLVCIKAGEQLNMRTIANTLRVSPTAVAKAIPKLKSAEIITSIKHPRMNLTNIELNRERPEVLELKRTENLKQLYSTGLLDLLEKRFPHAAIILFGSYSFGEDTTRSDVDIAIIGAKEGELDLSQYEKTLERKIVIQFYDCLMKIKKDLRDNILNGIRLRGVIST